MPPDAGTPRRSEPFSTPSGDARDADGNHAHTEGLQGTKTTYEDGTVVIDATERITAHYDSNDYGPANARQIRTQRDNVIVVHQENYCWQPRTLADARLEENHSGFNDHAYENGYATRFGKNDRQDSGASSPVYKIVQTCSEVFGVSIKAEQMRAILGPDWKKDPRRLTAAVEIYRQSNRRFARVSIVEVGPGNPDAAIDLTWALDQFLETQGGAQVQYRIVI